MASSSQPSDVATPLPKITCYGSNLEVSGNLATRKITQIKMIREKKIDFESLPANKFDVKGLFNSQGMEQYFNLLDRPIYPNLIQEFWMKPWVLDRQYATAQEEEMVNKNHELQRKTRAEMGLPPFIEPKIHSNIGGLKIKILKGHFAALLRVTNSSKRISMYDKEGITAHKKVVQKCIEKPTVFSKDGKELDKKNLHRKTIVLTDKLYVVFRMLINCVIPRFGGQDTVSYPHRHLLYFLKIGVQVNFVDLIFSTLCKETSRGITSEASSTICILYPRLLSALFERADLVVLIKPYYPSLGISQEIEVFDDHCLKNMKFISKVAPTPQSELEVVRAQLYYGDLPIISKVDDLEVIKKFLQTVYQDKNILIPMSVVPDAPQMKNVPKRKQNKSTNKQSKPHTLRQNLMTNKLWLREFYANNQHLLLLNLHPVLPLQISPVPTEGYTNLLIPIAQLSPQIQTFPQHQSVTPPNSPQSTHQNTLSLSPNHIIETTSPLTPSHNIAPLVTTSTLPVIHLSVSSLLESLQHDLPHLTYLRVETVIHPNDLFHEFHKIQDYFNASMKTLAVQYVRISAATTIEKFSKCAHIKRIPDYPFILNELSTEILEFVFACQKQQYEEAEHRKIFEEEQLNFMMIGVARTAENAVVQWFAEEELFEEEQQRLIEVPSLTENDVIQWCEEEITRMAEEGRQQPLQIRAGPFDPIMEARMIAQEEKEHQMELKLDPLVDSQAQIKEMLAILISRRQPPQP
ncbi:hypothetical protein TSUD_278240 [Trifolium subterraneum]|uniref:Uncharacterized protein n=1 Tax=Trifolium subterraneum TaxID=3900 RepID=A0A2Z6MBH6_TRISU|nr:hypothetical protein TSUD_278240 [Trifolium subterraneum]